jgi:YebC/PmpR family DNA-binding regulatory protein
VFTKHAKLIAIAARAGADPDMNPALRSAIVNAKADNVPNSNIEKAIKKGSGADKDGMELMECLYEGRGPANSALMVEVITDNKNRSVTSVKTIFSKNGGNMGSSGSVAWMFERKGVIIVPLGEKDKDEAELTLIDSGAEDLSFDEGKFEVITEMSELMNVRDKIEAAGFAVEKAELAFIPNETVEISSADEAKKILKLYEALDDDDDVSQIYGNFEIKDEILDQLS